MLGQASGINNLSDISPIVVVSTTTVYSKSFKLKYDQTFGIWLLMGNGSGTANMKIQLEQSYKPPTTEGSSDTIWVIGDGVADIYTNLNDGATPVAHIKTISPAPMPYGRLKITGLAANPADATLQSFIFAQGIIG